MSGNRHNFENKEINDWFEKTIKEQQKIKNEITKHASSMTPERNEVLEETIRINWQEIMAFHRKISDEFKKENTKLNAEENKLQTEMDNIANKMQGIIDKQVEGNPVITTQKQKDELTNAIKATDKNYLDLKKDHEKVKNNFSEIKMAQATIIKKDAEFSAEHYKLIQGSTKLFADLKNEKEQSDTFRSQTVANLQTTLDTYLENRNKKRKTGDSFKRAGANISSLFGLEKDPDYRKRREYIADLKSVLDNYSKLGDDTSKDALREKVLEGEQFKPTKGSDETLEKELQLIAKQLDLGIDPKYRK